MPRAAKKQINLKMRESLIEALKSRAIDEGDTFTDVVVRACEEYLESESDRLQTTTSSFEPTQLDKRIAAQLAPLQERLVTLETSLGELSA